MKYSELLTKISIVNKNWQSIKAGVLNNHELNNERTQEFLNKTELFCANKKGQIKVNDILNNPRKAISEFNWLLSNSSSNQIKRSNLNEINFSDDLQIELRFPGGNFNVIWKIKEHPLLDKERTNPSKASIQVVLG